MLARSGEITAPCPVPLSLTLTTPSSSTPALSHFWIRRMMRRSPIRCSRNRPSHSWLTVSKNVRMSASKMKFTFRLLSATTSASECVVRPAAGPESVAEPEEICLIDGIQHSSGRPLDDLVLKGCDRERALPPVRLGNVYAPCRQCPVSSSMDTSMQVLKIALEVLLVVPPRQPVHAGSGILFKFVERLVEQVDADVVEERGEPLLLPFLCDFPYALQCL